MTIRRAPTLKTGTFSRFQFGDSEREDILYKKQLKKPHALGRQTSEREELHYKKKALKSHRGKYKKIEKEVKNMTTKKATSSQQVLLSAKKLAELGNELTDIMNVLEMNNLALEGLEFALQKDTTTFLWLAKKYTDTAYAQNEKLYDRLNEIAFLLLNNDDAKELEAYHD